LVGDRGPVANSRLTVPLLRPIEDPVSSVSSVASPPTTQRAAIGTTGTIASETMAAGTMAAGTVVGAESIVRDWTAASQIAVSREAAGPSQAVAARPQPHQGSAAPALVLAGSPPGAWTPTAVQRDVGAKPALAMRAVEPEAAPPVVSPVVHVQPVAETPNAESSGALAMSPPAEPVGKDPDQIAQELFVPLLRRLKAELQLDRERRGALIDL